MLVRVPILPPCGSVVGAVVMVTRQPAFDGLLLWGVQRATLPLPDEGVQSQAAERGGFKTARAWEGQVNRELSRRVCVTARQAVSWHLQRWRAQSGEGGGARLPVEMTGIRRRDDRGGRKRSIWASRQTG